MVSQKTVIRNATGLHLRPAGLFTKTAMQFQCKVTFHAKNTYANAKSILGVLGACIKKDDEIEIICEGVDEEEALKAMIQIIEDGLGE